MAKPHLPEKPDVLLALAERCEAAPGPDRELFLQIAQACGVITPDAFPHSDGSFWWADGVAWGPIPDYFASIDAALTLVPEGHGEQLDLSYEHGDTFARISLPPALCTPENEGWTVAHSRADSLALALCAAALRAHAATQPEKPA